MDQTRDELRRRYRAERDKRLRADGNAQYLQPVGRFSALSADPYTSRTERAPLHTEVEVAIVGAGFAGLVTGAALRRAGVTDIRLIDTAGDVGGVWYWNRYPGAMCDTAAMIYLPLIEAAGTVPTAKYVGGREIHAHAQRLANAFGLYEGALFHTAITDVAWEEDDARWAVRTNRGDVLRARFVVVGTGPLSRPKLPGVPGLESFAGSVFHTSRWDYDATGGDASGAPMTKLAGKRVGIIGTGATGVQCIPHLALTAGELSVFQRTPSSVDVRDNEPIDAEWFASLEPGWQLAWLRNFATLQAGGFADDDFVADGWTDISRRIRDRVMIEVAEGAPLDADTVRRAYEACDDEKMDEIRDRVDSIVTDRTTAEGLKPWYRQLCKRPCFHDEYLATFNRTNVRLVDTDGRGVERVDDTGVWAAGRHHPLDVLVLASGFETGTALSRRTGFDITGRRGQMLDDHWADGMRTLHGIHTTGFPNLFVIGHAQGANLISNITHNYVEVSAAVADVVAYALRIGARVVEPTETAEAAWIALLESAADTSMLGDPDCTPGYYNNEGAPIGRRERLGAIGHPGGPMGFFEHLDAWRATGRFEGLDFSR